MYKSDQNSKLSSVDNVPSHHSGAQGRDVAGCKRSGAVAKAGWGFFKLGFLLSYKSDQNSKLSSVDNVPSHHSASGAQGRDVAGCKRSGAAAKAGWLCS